MGALTGSDNLPLLITFLSTHQSPNTVNRKASELVIGTVKDSSSPHQHVFPAHPTLSTFHLPSPTAPKKRQGNLPALPINKKNHTLPVRLITSGIAYLGLRNRSTTPKRAPRNFDLIQLDFTDGESRIGCGGGECCRAAARMNGVVKPQAIPMRRNPMTYRKMDGAGSGEGVVSIVSRLGS